MEQVVDDIYVINMDADKDRLNEFHSMMSSFHWGYQRYPSINGKKLSSPYQPEDDIDLLKSHLQLKNKYVKWMNFLTNSEIGCLLSHVSLWEKVANDPNKKRILIFEDDARTHLDGKTISNYLQDYYQYLDNNKMDEPDMLYLGKSLDDCMNYEKVWGNIYKSRHPLCLHAYIITKSGAQKLLKLAPYNIAIDMLPISAIKQKIINVCVFHPSIFYQDVINTKSNLRSLRSVINNTTECLSTQQYIDGDTWYYIIIIIIALVASIILFYKSL